MKESSGIIELSYSNLKTNSCMDIYCGDGSILCYQCMSLMSEGSVASLGVCKEMTVYSLLSFVLYSVG